MTLQRSSYLSLALILITIVALTMPAGAQSPSTCNSNDMDAPCFANVPDIQNGKTRLLQDDDLVMNTNCFNPNTILPYPAGEIC
jgi:hypothetical protein